MLLMDGTCVTALYDYLFLIPIHPLNEPDERSTGSPTVVDSRQGVVSKFRYRGTRIC